MYGGTCWTLNGEPIERVGACEMLGEVLIAKMEARFKMLEAEYRELRKGEGYCYVSFYFEKATA